MGFCSEELRRLIAFAIDSGAPIGAPFYFRRDMTTVSGNSNATMTLDYCRVRPRSLHCSRFVNVRQREEEKMKNPLDSLWGTVIAGLVLTVILYYITKAVIGG